jgi:zinc protease
VIQAGDDMFRRPVDLALEAAFGARGYGIPVKGIPASVRQLSAVDVAEWHRTELAAGRTSITVVGDIDPPEAAARLAGLLGDIPAAEALARPTVAPWSRVSSELVESRAKSQTALAMAFPGPARNDPDRHAAEVLAAVASGLGGRLFSSLRDKRSLAYTVLMASWQRLGAGAILTYIATSPDREDEARAAMLVELERFRDDGVTEDELSRAVNYLAGQARVQRQTAGAVAAELTDAWLIGSGLDELVDPAAPYRAVTREAVREVAVRWLDADRRSEGVVRGGR